MRSIYMYFYTDQENEVLTTLHIQWFTVLCDHKYSVVYVQHSNINKYNAITVRFTIDMIMRMCKTKYDSQGRVTISDTRTVKHLNTHIHN